MTDRKKVPRIAALQALEETFHRHCHARAAAGDGARRTHRGAKLRHRARAVTAAAWWRIRGGLRRPIIRKLIYTGAGLVAVFIVGVLGLWWRLSVGPIELDLATPWLAAAIEQNVGNRHHVEIGGTQLERDETGHISLRIRDIVVRDADGAVVASAPKAEVAVSTARLLLGSLRATRVSLVGAELAIRIERDGQVTISTGAERRPLAVTPAIVKPAPAGTAPSAPTPGAPTPPGQAVAVTAPQNIAEAAAAFFSWIDGLGASEEEGLGEIGLKNGSLSVDDQRTAKQWTFDRINLSMNRPRRGGIVFSLSSDGGEHPWLLTAAVKPSGYQRRSVQIEARKVSVKDILLALRMDEGKISADIPLSGVIRAEIGPDYLPQTIEGRLLAEEGDISSADNPEDTTHLDRAEISLDWDAGRRSLLAPFQIRAGGARVTLLSQFDAPREAGGPWQMTVTGGSIVLASPGTKADAPLVLNRLLLRARLDFAGKRVVLDQGEIGGGDVRLAVSGNLDWSGAEPRLAGGMAGRPMSGLSALRIWPAFVAPKVRNWVLAHFHGGAIERLTVASNAPLDTLKEGGRPIPDEGMLVEVVVKNGIIQPLDTLPAIRDADMTTRITGRKATVTVDRGVVDFDSGRKLVVSNGVFEVPDTFPPSPPARARFHVEGPVPAAAEFMALDAIRDPTTPAPDPATSRGAMSGDVTVALPITKDPPPGATTYTINAELTNFSAEKMMMGQKLEAQALKVLASEQGVQIKGDVKLNGTPVSLDYRKARGESEADVRIQGIFDEAARVRLGFDVGSALAGPVPARFSGRLSGDKDARLTVEADLTQARIDNLLPGWVKAPGKPARASHTLVIKPQSTRIEDLTIEGSGAQLKGNIEFDSSGDLAAANFPTFALSDGDKATLKADRGPDNALRVVMRGDVYDGRGFIKSVMAGASTDQKSKRGIEDIDLDIRLGAVAGFNGEALRGVDMKMSRRGGHIRALALNCKIGRDATLMADLRTRNNAGGGSGTRPVIYLETMDAGALFRFTDMYSRIAGGQMWVALDAPTPDQAPQEGILSMRDFAVRGEAALDRVVSQAANGQRSSVDFSRLRVDFTRALGKVSFRDGVVRGPVIGATMDGTIDYLKNEVHMRGTFVPLYGLNNAFGQIPIVGLFLGGSNEGLLGVTYEVVGTPGAPILRVNPISAVAPGLLRKFFEFPGERATRDAAPPSPSR